MNGQDEYLESKVMTASPYHLHLLVIDGAIRHALQAEQAMATDEFETAHFALNDSRAFVGELVSGLDDGQAPELVDPLKGLFLFAFRNLVEADLQRDVAKIQDAIAVLRSHRETWLALADKLENLADDDSATSAPPRPHHLSSETGELPGRSWTS